MSEPSKSKIERPGLVHILPPFYLMLAAWVAFYLEWRSGRSWSTWGLFPRTLEGLVGVITMPFLHADMVHLINNSVPLIVLGSVLRYFYKSLFWLVVFTSWLITGLITWGIAREAYHIGASGLVYALASFLFFSGAFRKHRPLMAVSFFVVFVYGSMVWGVLPIEPTVSWEGHLSGAIAGLFTAVAYRHIGPQAPRKEIEVITEPTNREIFLEEQAMRYPSPEAYGRKYWEEHAHQTQPLRIVYQFQQQKIKEAPPLEEPSASESMEGRD
ncbi:MAG: rhomboid family intramembrane serine protease [Flavobacteriales bacterium]|nr:rhomboid family intramembrane serine protease [Flavobacteriales bacterium]